MEIQPQPTTTMSAEARFATKRLYRDWKELEQEKANLTTVTALPTSNLFVWHCNLRPDDGPYAGTIFHLILTFPDNYPHAPPKVRLCSYLAHPNVFGGYICLDMIQECYTAQPFVGWTSAYSILSILLQLQSFLFAENIPQSSYRVENGQYNVAAIRSENANQRSIAAAHEYSSEHIQTHDGRWVKHTHQQPWPPFEATTTIAYVFGRRTTQRRNNNNQTYTKIQLRPRQSNQHRQQQQGPFFYCPKDFPALGGDGEEKMVGVLAPEAEQSEQHRILTEEEESVSQPPALPPPSPATLLPTDVYCTVFSFLSAKELLRAQNVCCQWRRIVVGCNLFERTQIQCFHSKATLDSDPEVILGVGLKVEYYNPQQDALKTASSPLDLLSWQAFEAEGVRTGVWGGETEKFTHFLPLVLNPAHASKAVQHMEQTIFEIMKNCRLPNTSINCNSGFHPFMAFHLLAVLMNSMVVELMNSAQQLTGRQRRQPRGVGQGQRTPNMSIQRHASEKALEGYCAFHHLLLYFAKRYPTIIQFADWQVDQFLSNENYRHKQCTPNLGVLLVCLTLSRKGWDQLRKPLVMEAFDRNVRWILQKRHALGRPSLAANSRLRWTFDAARTSLRLLMFQAYFMSRIGRPADTQGPMDVLARYNQRWGKPTTAQKEDLQQHCKAILAVNDWSTFFQRLGGPVPNNDRVYQILKQAVHNSKHKRYHYQERYI